MAKIEITKTELVWPGKYNEDGTLKEVPRVSLPFQVIETINESRASRETRKSGVQRTLFDVYEGKEGDTFEEGWKNKLIWGDNLLVMGSLLEKFAGKIDLIYIDPPFATGADFAFRTEIGESGEEMVKEQSVIEEKAYRDTWAWGHPSYLNMMRSRLLLLRDLLSTSGSIYVHCDWRMAGMLRLVCDEVFGSECFQNEIAWCYREAINSTKRWNRKHDNILFFSRDPDAFCFNPDQVLQPHSQATVRKYKYEDEKGRYRLMGRGIVGSPIQSARDVAPEWEKTHPELVYRHYLRDGTYAVDYWNIDVINQASHERVGYATQKPEELLTRILKASSSPGDLVADFFCGSGTTLAVAEKLGRRWIGCDLGRWAIHVTRKRLLGIENCKPFEVLNLGKYERQYWQGLTFGEKKEKSLTERALYEYLAFILKLYGAQPVAGMAHLHGKKGKAMVHIGAVDAPVTIAEVDTAVDECLVVKQTELHVLGWDWEMGLYDLVVEQARKKGVKLLLLQIPREVMEQQAVEKGDVHFFELAYLEARITQPKKLSAQVELKDFVIPNMELIPEDVRSKVKKWSDYIDYWAVDWDFQNDTFMQGWVAYRTRRDRRLTLVSDPHTYNEAGAYRIVVKVIDVFGNDTSQAFDVAVS